MKLVVLSKLNKLKKSSEAKKIATTTNMIANNIIEGGNTGVKKNMLNFAKERTTQQILAKHIQNAFFLFPFQLLDHCYYLIILII